MSVIAASQKQMFDPKLLSAFYVVNDIKMEQFRFCVCC